MLLNPRQIGLVIIVCIAAMMSVSTSVEAAPIYRIDSVVHGTTGGFGHSLFHSASQTTNGQRLAYFDLDQGSTAPNYYNPSTGELRFSGNLYSDQNMTNHIGVFSAASGNLMGDDLSDNVWDGDLAGSIEFTLTFSDASSTFFQHMSSETGSSGPTHVSTLYYVDRQYGGVEPLFANSLDLDAGLLSLWGADGNVTGNGNFSASILGADIVLALVEAPEPSSIALWSLASVCCIGAARRRRKRNNAA